MEDRKTGVVPVVNLSELSFPNAGKIEGHFCDQASPEILQIVTAKLDDVLRSTAPICSAPRSARRQQR